MPECVVWHNGSDGQSITVEAYNYPIRDSRYLFRKQPYPHFQLWNNLPVVKWRDYTIDIGRHCWYLYGTGNQQLWMSESAFTNHNSNSQSAAGYAYYHGLGINCNLCWQQCHSDINRQYIISLVYRCNHTKHYGQYGRRLLGQGYRRQRMPERTVSNNNSDSKSASHGTGSWNNYSAYMLSFYRQRGVKRLTCDR